MDSSLSLFFIIYDIFLENSYITAGTTILSGFSYVGGGSLKMSTNVENESKEKQQTLLQNEKQSKQ